MSPLFFWLLIIVVVVVIAVVITVFSLGLQRAGSARADRVTPTQAVAARSLHEFTFTAPTGATVAASSWKGKVVLLVNTASRCGYTKQYDGLQALHQRMAMQGLQIIAVPSNDFLGQEPEADAAIQEFCRLNHGVTFPVLAKEHVSGAQAHPWYAWLERESPTPGPVEWNFVKLVIGRDGKLVGRFGPKITPADPALLAAIDQALAVQP